MKSYTTAVCRWTRSIWQRLIGAVLIAFFLADCSLAPPTPGEFYLPTPSFTPTLDPRDYTPTPLIYPTSANGSPVPKQNCTFPAEYWKDHLENWQFAVITVGGKTYSKQEALVFYDSQPKNTYLFIYEQVFTIANNILSGADPQMIDQVLVQMNRWLDEHPVGSLISEAEQNTGIYLARQIELYNLGFIGPGLCASAQAVATAEFAYLPVGETSTPTYTETPVPQFTSGVNQPPPAQPPSATPKPTRKSGGGGGGPAPTQPPPSNTPAPPPPTQAPPTNTKAPTKVPTPTSPPLATPVPTKPPNPTPGGGPPTPTSAP